MADSTEPRAQLHDTPSQTLQRTSPLVTTTSLPLHLHWTDPFSSACCRHSRQCRCRRQHRRHVSLHCVGRLPDFELLADSCRVTFLCGWKCCSVLEGSGRGRCESSCEFPSIFSVKSKKRTFAGLLFTLVTVYICGFLVSLSPVDIVA